MARNTVRQEPKSSVNGEWGATWKKLDARSGWMTGTGRAVGVLFNSMRGKGAGGLLEEGERVWKERCEQGSPAFLPNSEGVKV